VGGTQGHVNRLGRLLTRSEEEVRKVHLGWGKGADAGR